MPIYFSGIKAIILKEQGVKLILGNREHGNFESHF